MSLKSRRFLIVWCCVNSFALLVNLAHIKGQIINSENKNDRNVENVVVNLFTDGGGIDEDYSFFHPATFYPFTSEFYSNSERGVSSETGSWVSYSSITWYKNIRFYGVFNGYSYLEFIVYIILGFAIVFIPKMW